MSKQKGEAIVHRGGGGERFESNRMLYMKRKRSIPTGAQYRYDREGGCQLETMTREDGLEIQSRVLCVTKIVNVGASGMKRQLLKRYTV